MNVSEVKNVVLTFCKEDPILNLGPVSHMPHPADQQFADALAVARKCKVVVVQKATGKIMTHAKQPKGWPRGPEVGGSEIKRRMQVLQRKGEL